MQVQLVQPFASMCLTVRELMITFILQGYYHAVARYANMHLEVGGDDTLGSQPDFHEARVNQCRLPLGCM